MRSVPPGADRLNPGQALLARIPPLASAFFTMFETFYQDLKIGLRVLTKDKSFCALAVFVLSIGIAAVTTQFAIINGVLLTSLDFPAPEQLVDVRMVDEKDFRPDNFNSRMTTQDFADIRESQTSFTEFAAFINGSTVNLTYQGQPRRLTGGYVTHNYFATLGKSPVLGRDFLPAEDQPGVSKAVIITDSLWHRDFGGTPDVIGRPVIVNGESGSIVGVMEPGFSFPNNEQLWIPLNSSFPVRPRNARDVNFVDTIGRLAPGVSRDQAEAEITSFARSFAQDYPDTNAQFTKGFLRPVMENFTPGNLKGMLYTMMAFCAGVLLMACVNVMNMQFARATLRAKELAIRSSLGATRGRLIRQMLTESLLVASIGAVVGISIAMWSTDFLDHYLHNNANPIPNWMTFDLDPPVLIIVVVATMLSAIVSGFVPAWMSSRTDSIEVLKEGGRGNTSRSVMFVTRSLVVFQILATCILLIGSLLQLRSIIHQQNLDFGYDTDGVIAARMGLMEGDYPSAADRKLFYERLLQEMRTTGQFDHVALTNRFRMVFSGEGPVEIEGQQYLADSDRTSAQFENISDEYFATLGLDLISGRDFTTLDHDQREPVAIVNAQFARKHWGDQNPLGKRFRTIQNNGSNPSPWRTVVGVAPNVLMQGPFDAEDDGAGFYVPYHSAIFGPVPAEPVANQFGTLVLRPRGDQNPATMATTVQRLVNRVDPNLPLYFTETPRTSIEAFTAQNKVVAGMFSFFGIVAISLAAVGLYGVMSFSVNQRTQEIGVRMALGADGTSILSMVLRQGAWQLGIGLLLGLTTTLIISVLGGSGLQNNLPGVSVRDPLTYAGVALLLLIVALASILVPAKRATRVDPMIALRAE
jgi:putative ABC transport system permease protein